MKFEPVLQIKKLVLMVRGLINSIKKNIIFVILIFYNPFNILKNKKIENIL